MGPAFGTKAYDDQVDRIVKAISSADLNPKEIDTLLFAYILDTEYSRAAICEAEKILKSLVAADRYWEKRNRAAVLDEAKEGL